MQISPFNELLQALEQLDERLMQAKEQMLVCSDVKDQVSSYVGLSQRSIMPQEVEYLLTCKPAAVYTSSEQPLPHFFAKLSDAPFLLWLARTFRLSAFDIDVLLIALAPEVDLRYERLYAYLQNDSSRTSPTVELVLRLVCSSAESKLAHYGSFGAEGPLIHNGLLHLISQQTRSSFLAHVLKVDAQIIRFLFGEFGLDPRLASFCQLISMEKDQKQMLEVQSSRKDSIRALIERARTEQRSLRLYLYGPRDAGQREAAEDAAHYLQMDLLIVECVGIPLAEAAFEQILRLLFREARLQHAIMLLEGIDHLRTAEFALLYTRVLALLATYNGVILLSGSLPWDAKEHISGGVVTISFDLPDFQERRTHWQREIERHALEVSAAELDTLASRFRLTTGQITHSIASVCIQRSWQPVQLAANTLQIGEQSNSRALFAAASLQSSHAIAALAHKIDTVAGWNELVLPVEQIGQLRELCDQIRYRHIVYEQWGFGHKFTYGKDVNALLSGPSGTGKTLAAGVIGNVLGLEVYKVNLSQIVSKYIGETEKNLESIFTAAESANAILFFDEADALFGKRSQISDAHDRYANIEVGYLLQKMEEYNGIALLATNLRTNMDDAFIRRLKFCIEFPLPEEASRLRIWQKHFPSRAPRSDDIDFSFLAQRFKLSGGNIKNIVLNASFLAAAHSEPIAMQHLILATHREFQKMGKMSLESEFGHYYRIIKDYDR